VIATPLACPNRCSVCHPIGGCLLGALRQRFLGVQHGDISPYVTPGPEILNQPPNPP